MLPDRHPHPAPVSQRRPRPQGVFYWAALGQPHILSRFQFMKLRCILLLSSRRPVRGSRNYY